MGLFSSALSMREMSFLVTSLGRTYTAGIPLLRCFSLLAEGSGSRVVRRIAKTIGADIEGGATLIQALNRHHRRFPPFFLGMVEVAEETGSLGAILELLSRYYEKMLELHRSFERQVSYPVALLMGIMIGVPIVVRILSSLVESGDVNLFYSIAMFVVWRVLGIVVALTIIAIVYRIPGVRRMLRTALFYLPPLSIPMRRLGLARFGWSMEMACGCGFSLPRSIRIGRRACDLLPMEIDLGRVASRLEEHATLSEAMGPSRYLRVTDKSYLTAAEHSGRIPEGFRQMAEASYREGIFALQVIIMPLEAVLIVAIGFGVVPI